MKLYNTLTRKTIDFKPLNDKTVRMYSCGPTVYDHIHIGNLSSFIYADTLRRVLTTSGYRVQHVMNFTDVDDKTIRRSQEEYPDMSPETALQTLTDHYGQLFLTDMTTIGNDASAVTFVKATAQIQSMQKLIAKLYKDNFAYIADDGVYFSIKKYKDSGKKYGQLLELDASNTSEARINNDEYDKESVHDFALWKLQKAGEPTWEFELDKHMLLGRPGWHIECSAMSTEALGQPFDIHTGGVDLIFPHHENEIAQSTAGESRDYAKFFVHNEHLLVNGRKMSKSLNNFYTLEDVKERGFDPLAFRLLVLQSHYRSQSNFTWENLAAAQNRLKRWEAIADLRWQLEKSTKIDMASLLTTVQMDLDTPRLLSQVDTYFDEIEQTHTFPDMEALQLLNQLLGMNLLKDDITPDQKQLIRQRELARSQKEWQRADELRDQLAASGIGINDTGESAIWYRL